MSNRNFLHDPFQPASLAEYVGQTQLKERLLIHINSAVIRRDRLPHMLFVAAPGQGKTSLARLVAKEAQQTFVSYVMPIDPTLLYGLMRSFKGICFFDEIHRMKDQEIMLPILQDHYVQHKNGQRIYNHDICFIGATTEGDRVIAPLYERFMVPPFDNYSTDDLILMVTSMSTKIGVALCDGTIAALAAASGGSPRMAGQMVTMARDLAVSIDLEPTANMILRACRVSSTGLTEEHVRYLATLQALGGTAGVSLIANHLRIPTDRLLTLERLLVTQELITYTRAGRALTMSGSMFAQEEES